MKRNGGSVWHLSGNDLSRASDLADPVICRSFTSGRSRQVSTNRQKRLPLAYLDIRVVVDEMSCRRRTLRGPDDLRAPHPAGHLLEGGQCRIRVRDCLGRGRVRPGGDQSRCRERNQSVAHRGPDPFPFPRSGLVLGRRFMRRHPDGFTQILGASGVVFLREQGNSFIRDRAVESGPPSILDSRLARFKFPHEPELFAAIGRNGTPHRSRPSRVAHKTASTWRQNTVSPF